MPKELKFASFVDIEGKTFPKKIENLYVQAKDADSLQIDELSVLSFANADEKKVVLQNLEIQIELEKIKDTYAKAQQKAGYERAKIAGVKLGGKRKPIPKNFENVCQQYENLEISQREAGRLLNVSQHTFIRWFDKRNETHKAKRRIATTNLSKK